MQTRFTVTAWHNATDHRAATVLGFQSAIEARAEMLLQAGKPHIALVTVNGLGGVLVAYAEHESPPVYIGAAFRSACTMQAA